MALPVLSKTWQFSANQQVGSLSALPACNQNAMLAVKNALKGFASAYWSVWQSSDSAACGTPGDAVDRWVTAANLVWAAGSHSWIVLRQPGLGTKTAICIDLNNASSWLGSVVLSPSYGFGLANGGVDGTISARPQASDEIVLLSGAAWGGYNGTYTWRLSVMQSTDGKCCRVVMFRNGASSALWLFDWVKNQISTWTRPIVGLVIGDSALAGAVSYANLSTAANTKGKIDSDTCSFYMTYEGYGTQGLPPAISVPDDDTGEWPLHAVGLYTASNRHRGRKGEMYDLWWGPEWPGGGDTYPDDVSRAMIQLGDIILPWDGSVPWTYV